MTGTALAPAAPVPPPLPDQLDALLRRMRFPYLRKAAPEVLATARAQRWDPAEVIRILLEEEIRGRTRQFCSDQCARRYHNDARISAPAAPLAADSSIPLPAQHALMTLEWVTRAENLAIAGPSGTGKSHFAEALAHKAIDTGMRVAWFTLETLTATIGRAAVDGTTAKAIARITRCDLITIDDIGMLPAGQAAAEALYRLVDAAYERRSLILTSNLQPSGLDTIMPKTLATATVDRLLHPPHLVLTEGTSLRLAEATTGKGVTPLT